METSTEGVMASAVLPPWDKENPEEAGLLCTSEYKDLINKNRVKLCDNLEPKRIWAHLRQLHVLDKVTEERLKHNLPRPDVVLKLLEFIESGPRWCFHGFCRALALTGQSDMIPKGGLEPKFYEKGAPLKQLPKSLIKLIHEHCRSNVESLMKTRLFDFEGDPDDDTIDISQCFVPVDPMIKGSQQKMIAIATKQILEQLSDKVPPQVVRMYGDPGDGKTSLMMHIAHCWSAEFLKFTDEELSSKCPRWNTIVYLSAPKIKGTVEEAIRDELGCKEKDADTLMEHVTTGDGTGVFIDSLDEVRDKKVMENIKHYVHQRKKKGGPTVLIAARTDLCPIDVNDIDRKITVQGFTETQGLDYVKKYTEMCEVPQQPEQPLLVEYVIQYREELKSLLTNPLRLYVFSALAVRGELDLVNERGFNIPKLFGPLERYLLRREGSEVTNAQQKDFYRFCMHGLLNDFREFPENLLAKFNIAKAYYVFLRRSSRRGPDGAPSVYYSFSHEVLYEYFASRYIHSLTTEQRKSLLLSVCSNEQLRNVQYIIFQLLLQEWETQKDLIVSMIRCMLILQFSAPDNKVKSKFIDLMSLHYTVKECTSLESLLDENHMEINIGISSRIWEKVNNTFDKGSDRLQESGWYGYLCLNGTVNHVIRCLEACSVQQRETLFESTTSHLMPCRYDLQNECVDFFQVGRARWGEIQRRPNIDNKMEHLIFVSRPSEAHEVLMQFTKRHPEESGSSLLTISFGAQRRFDKHLGDWSEDEWRKLVMELTALDELSINVHAATPLKSMFTIFAELLSMLQHPMKVNVMSGRVPLANLLSTLPRLKQVPSLSLYLCQTSVVVPNGEDEAMLRVQRDRVCGMTMKETKYWLERVGNSDWTQHSRQIDKSILYKTEWVTESGEKYVWSD